MFNIVLVEPEIPQNTGNIVRLCAATDSVLYLVGKLGFSTENKYLKRAGLDYWEFVNVQFRNSLEDLFIENKNDNFYFFSKKASKIYSEINFEKGDFLVFGKESFGLPEKLLEENKKRSLKIPVKNVRSLNLANSVAITLYEGLRQNNFFNG
ncbi:MAG: tRNA (cytidine(34)-2'-O)-methyltransferase [Candidatus Muiribacteriota bacterium]